MIASKYDFFPVQLKKRDFLHLADTVFSLSRLLKSVRDSRVRPTPSTLARESVGGRGASIHTRVSNSRFAAIFMFNGVRGHRVMGTDGSDDDGPNASWYGVSYTASKGGRNEPKEKRRD